MRTALVLFTRDLRLHDHPALTCAVERAERVLPLFVLDDSILRDQASPNRIAFLRESLADLDGSLERVGGRLVIRRGEVVAETVRLAEATGAEAIFLSEDVSAYAQARERRLERACREARIELSSHPGVTAVPPGDVAPSGSDHFQVFTPYWRAWQAAVARPVDPAPRAVTLPSGVVRGRLPALADLVAGRPSPDRAQGGETAARKRLDTWARSGLARYEELHDDLAADGTSRLSPYLHLGCLSPREVVERLKGREGAEAFVRQLCWRDFFHQLLAARPETVSHDLRPRGDRWRDDDAELAAWQTGRTGYPIVDAGMRQLAREGWMHNRARLVVGSFLTKHLYLDWRDGARHFADQLLDGDVASNTGNWQWVAGTGADTRPNRVLNPLRQAARFDPDGVYVRRYVPELAEVEGRAVHEPWRLGLLRPSGYPEPIVGLEEALGRFRAARR